MNQKEWRNKDRTQRKILFDMAKEMDIVLEQHCEDYEESLRRSRDLRKDLIRREEKIRSYDREIAILRRKREAENNQMILIMEKLHKDSTAKQELQTIFDAAKEAWLKLPAEQREKFHNQALKRRASNLLNETQRGYNTC